MVERLRDPGLRRDKHRLSARAFDRPPRNGELDLLDAFVGDEERHAPALELRSHLVLLSNGPFISSRDAGAVNPDRGLRPLEAVRGPPPWGFLGAANCWRRR